MNAASILRRFRRAETASTRSPDAPLLRRVRWRLILWSGGSTLALLAVLGGLLYWAVAERLRSESIEQLTARATGLVIQQVMPMPVTDGTVSIQLANDPSAPGFVFGGAASGTIAFVVPLPAGSPNDGSLGVVGGAAPAEPGDALTKIVIDPADAAVTAAMAGRTTIEERDVKGIPVRAMTAPIDIAGTRGIAQVMADRTAEVRTLQTLLAVLVLGGLLVVLAAVALGYVYAGRALVPIRDSLRRQREFAADASHELRTPLAIVTSAVEHLRRRRDDRAAADLAIEDLQAGTQRLTSLVDDLLLLARADADAVEVARLPTDLAELATDATAGFAGLAESRSVSLRLDVEPSPVAGDEARLRQLVGILVDNAIRHSPDGGAVTVRVRPGAEVIVDDEGVGIREQDLPNVFRRFWRAADAPPGGTGLGLAIAEWIATSHGGRIRAANRPEGGARFSVTIPGLAPGA